MNSRKKLFYLGFVAFAAVGMSGSAVAETLNGVVHDTPAPDEKIWYQDGSDSFEYANSIDWASFEDGSGSTYAAELTITRKDDNGDFVGFYQLDTVNSSTGDSSYSYSVTPQQITDALGYELGAYNDYVVRTAVYNETASTDESKDWIGFHETNFTMEEWPKAEHEVTTVNGADGVSKVLQGDSVTIEAEVNKESFNQVEANLVFDNSTSPTMERSISTENGVSTVSMGWTNIQDSSEIPRSMDITFTASDGQEFVRTVDASSLVFTSDLDTVLKANDSESFTASTEDLDGFEVQEDSLVAVNDSATATLADVPADRYQDLSIDVNGSENMSAEVIAEYHNTGESETFDLVDGNNSFNLSAPMDTDFTRFKVVSSNGEIEVESIEGSGLMESPLMIGGGTGPTGGFFNGISLPSVSNAISAITNTVSNVFNGILGVFGL